MRGAALPEANDTELELDDPRVPMMGTACKPGRDMAFDGDAEQNLLIGLRH